MKLCEWKPKGGNHRFMMVDKSKVVSTEKSGLFCFMRIKIKALTGGNVSAFCILPQL